MNIKKDLLRIVSSAIMLATLLQTASAFALESGRFANVYLSNEPVVVTLAQTDARRVRLHNNDGVVIAETTPLRASMEANFGPQSPGYYTVQTANGASLPVVVLVNPIFRAADESHLGSDNAMANLVDPAQFNDYANLLRVLGLNWVRERLSWAQTEPWNGAYNWDTRSEQAVGALTAQGLKVSQVFHSAPAWARSDQNTQRAPDDLRDIYNFSKSMAAYYKGRVQAWEPWNEPDLSFFDDSASEMAAYQKVAYLGFHSVDASTQVLSPSIGVAPAAFTEHMLQNGMGAYFDVWNYHDYGDAVTEFDVPTRYAERAEAFRSLLARNGVINRPMWVTESGVPSGTTGTPDATRRYEQAAFLSRAFPYSLMAGNDRVFWFALPYMQAFSSDWGLFEPDGKTPLPGLAALSTATYALGRAEFLGQLSGLPADVRTAVFDRGNGTQTLVLWRDTAGETPVTLPIPASAVQSAVDFLGGPITTGDEWAQVTVKYSASYLILPAGMLDALLTNQPQKSVVQKPAASPLVVRLRISGASLMRNQDVHVITPGTEYSLTAEVYNFGPTAVPVYVGIDGSAASFLNVKLVQVTVPAGGRIQVPVKLKVTSAYAGGGLRLVAGNSAVASSPAVIYLRPATP